MNKNEIYGKYLSDVFLIEFPPHIKIFNKSGLNQGLKNQLNYATFVHEYWHYLLNISTAVLFRDFSIWHSLIPIFSKTLSENADGTAIGNNVSDDDKNILDEFTELIFAYNGGDFEGLTGKKIKNYKVVGRIKIEDYNLTLKGRKVPFKKIKIPLEVITENGKEKAFYILGNLAIDESIANSVEKIVFDNGSVPPSIPYLMLNKMSEFYNNGVALSNYELAAIGTLSFLTTNPAFSLEQLFIDYINLRKVKSERLSFDEICNRIKPDFMKIASVLLSDLQSIQDVYKGRQPADYAIDYVANNIKKSIDLRLTNLLFDLEPFETGVLNQDKLNNLIFKIIPPCDVKQELDGNEDDVGRDIIKSFDLCPINLNGNIIYSSYLMQVLQCQMDFFWAHWDLLLKMDSDTATSICPYYTTCDLSFRIDNPEICKSKPWNSFEKGKENCMYGSAVAALIGEVLIKKKNNA